MQSKRKAVELEWSKPDKQLQEEIDKVFSQQKPFQDFNLAYLYLYVTDCIDVEVPKKLREHVYIVSRKDQTAFYGEYRTSTVLGKY